MRNIRCSGQQPSVSLTGPGLFMKPTKSLPAETSAVWLSGDQYAAVHHPGKPSGHMKCWEWALWRWKGGTWIPYGVFFSAAYLLREKFSCLSFFSSTWLHWLIRFHVESECLCTVSTFLQQRDGYSSLQHITLLRWKRFLIQTAPFAEEKCLHVSDVYSGQLMFIWFNYLKTSCPGFIVSESVLFLHWLK